MTFRPPNLAAGVVPVIMPRYNREALLRAAIDCVLGLAGPLPKDARKRLISLSDRGGT
jgi:hypothetical protein